MEAMENLLTRRSCRNYTEKQVPDELLDKVLEAGTFAASGMNRQSTYLVAVRDKETRDLLSKINAGEIGLAFAVATIYMIPSLLVFMYGEDYLVEGITYQGGVKG